MIAFMIRNLEISLTQPEDQVISQNEEGDFMYFLARGDCEVKVVDESKKERTVKILRPGAMFGEVALLFNCKRTATVVSKNYCTMAKLAKKQFVDLYQKFPELYIDFKNRTKSYQDRWKLY
jgi:CRP-like cAMP-binding protein